MATQSTFEDSPLPLNGSYFAAWDLPESSTDVLVLDVWLLRKDPLLPWQTKSMSKFGYISVKKMGEQRGRISTPRLLEVRRDTICLTHGSSLGCNPDISFTDRVMVAHLRMTYTVVSVRPTDDRKVRWSSEAPNQLGDYC